ncbi:hypothetical protein CSUI_002587 [Cystoisospora suis]|uniref:Uncharacterized protein n=1 Tax=Cystoisospora suis TaxID=483139 RepID=A0A2C6L8C0_9APIC|nr:hypothetical protein CSUI_002587 [Cystoisospora suis]
MATHTFRITGGEPHEVCCCIQDCVKSARAACPFLMNPPPSVGFSRSKQSSTFSAFAEDCCNAVRFVEYLDFAVPPEEFSSELVPRLRQEYFLVSDAEFESTRKLRLEQWLRENSTSALSCTGLLPSEICLLRANLEREVQCPRTGASRD